MTKKYFEKLVSLIERIETDAEKALEVDEYEGEGQELIVGLLSEIHYLSGYSSILKEEGLKDSKDKI